MNAYAYKVGDAVYTPNGKCDGVIIQITGSNANAKALVCGNYFAASLLEFGQTVSYLRDHFRCETFYLADLMPDEDGGDE